MKSIELGTRFLFTILVYAKEKSSIREYVEKLKLMYSKHIPVSFQFLLFSFDQYQKKKACKWFLKLLIQKETPWLKSLLFFCPLSEPREILVRLIVHVMSCLAPYEKEFYSIREQEAMEVNN